MSGVLDRMEAAVQHAFNTTGQVPAYLHVAADVHREALHEAARYERVGMRFRPATREIDFSLPGARPTVPVRESRRLAPGYIVPVMPLEKQP